MSLEYSTLDELSSLISDTVVGHMIIRILELYGSFGPRSGNRSAVHRSFFAITANYCIYISE